VERQIIEVKEEKKTISSKPKKKVDLKNVAKVVSENKETIAAVASALGTLINSSNGKKTATKRTTTRKNSSAKKKTTSSKKKNSKSNDTVSTLVDMFLK
jgi:hypothetical protein